MLGQFKDEELVSSLISAYITGKGLLDSLIFNGKIVKRYIELQSSNEDASQKYFEIAEKYKNILENGNKEFCELIPKLLAKITSSIKSGKF
jgi:hypothetical protein